MKQGARIRAIGADAKGKLELETSLTKRAKVVVDDITRASHSGKINVSISEGSISPEDVYAKVTIFDSTGLAIHDVAYGICGIQKGPGLRQVDKAEAPLIG
jgi:alanine dehydrogenase